MAGTVQLDITTITLGEAAEAEIASGKSLQQLVKSRTGLLILALFIQELRSSGVAPNWSELANRRLLDVSSSIGQLQQAETPAK